MRTHRKTSFYFLYRKILIAQSSGSGLQARNKRCSAFLLLTNLRFQHYTYRMYLQRRLRRRRQQWPPSPSPCGSCLASSARVSPRRQTSLGHCRCCCCLHPRRFRRTLERPLCRFFYFVFTKLWMLVEDNGNLSGTISIISRSLLD